MLKKIVERLREDPGADLNQEDRAELLDAAESVLEWTRTWYWALRSHDVPRKLQGRVPQKHHDARLQVIRAASGVEDIDEAFKRIDLNKGGDVKSPTLGLMPEGPHFSALPKKKPRMKIKAEFVGLNQVSMSNRLRFDKSSRSSKPVAARTALAETSVRSEQPAGRESQFHLGIPCRSNVFKGHSNQTGV